VEDFPSMSLVPVIRPGEGVPHLVSRKALKRRRKKTKPPKKYAQLFEYDADDERLYTVEPEGSSL
jgi:hypothetical protein